MNTIYESMTIAADFIRKKSSVVPQIGILLGTGLGSLVDEIDTDVVIPYHTIPGFVTATMEFHEGNLILGTLSNKPVIALQGRFHYYEGYSMQDITFPIRVIKTLGASILIITNATGGINLDFSKGDLVLIRDHINFIGDNPLRGMNDERLGPRFPDMSQPYSQRLMAFARDVAHRENIILREGVYAAMAGPSLETAAEYRFLRIIGADMVGMSNVPENIVAVQMGMEVLGFAIISDLCDPDNLEPADIKNIVAICEGAEPRLTKLIREIIRTL
jgi:purine-nucleoside phosphorylase